jgi:ATP phosphoribosyltransferase regulatory subunit
MLAPGWVFRYQTALLLFAITIKLFNSDRQNVIMNDTENKALLPAGMSDALPSDAAFEAAILDDLLSAFAGHGYQQVKPPLIEFEEGLLSGLGAAMSAQTFRLMDPVSQRMMGVRADMTPQVARIAASRLKKAPRPLRLSYAGQVLRIKGSQLRPERQFSQVGAELIGVTQATADAEVIVMAAKALINVGVTDLSIDLGMPTLVPAICRELEASDTATSRLRIALDRKDAAEVTALSDELGVTGCAILEAMLGSAGPADKTMCVLNKLELGREAAAERQALQEVISLIGNAAPELTLTVDPVENRGFEYHTGVTFTFFVKGVRGELGMGGRYIANSGTDHQEPSTGFTLFMDTVLRALPEHTPQSRIYLPFGSPSDAAESLRNEGWAAIMGLAEVGDSAEEAKRLLCSHVLLDDQITKL